MGKNDAHAARLHASREDLLRRHDALIDQISKAFAQVSRQGGVSLREAVVRSRNGSQREHAEARSLDTDTHWSQFDPTAIDADFSILHFLDPIGYRYYLPAFMTHTLRRAAPSTEGHTPLCMENSLLYHLGASESMSQAHASQCNQRHALLTKPQRTCVARYLAYFVELAPLAMDAKPAVQALRTIWLSDLPHQERVRFDSNWPAP